ncbi:hypothetical protein NKR23_g5422 [Pleurostoma richardsiae]|uniref:Fungal N-terminal domain-containing protein n=1 Tax=Pleurostoma richardsiae TaxID=41990 RepID=A0AA38VQX0_9PEZI|nr:hypothetical protein NKR23_g5422 [Pleurostoma richardsiae]
MEAAVAVGLASSIVQFVDFGGKLVRNLKELRSNSNTDVNVDYLRLARDLRTIVQDLVQSNRSAVCQNGALPSESSDFLDIADSCASLASKIIDKLESVALQSGSSTTTTKRVKAALKASWRGNEIDELAKRLQYYRDELQIRMLMPLRETAKNSATRADIEALELRLSQALDLGPQLRDFANHVDASIANLQETQRQTLQDTRDEVQSVRTKLAASADSSHQQYSSLNEVIASIKVDNANFNAQCVQHVESVQEFQRNFFQLFEPALQTHKDGQAAMPPTVPRTMTKHYKLPN